MGITTDSSTPTVKLAVASNTSVTSNSFSPPSSTLLLASISMTTTSSGTTPTFSISDSKGGTWSTADGQQEEQGICVTQSWYRYLSSAPGNMTVKVTQSANAKTANMALDVRVLNGVVSTSPIGATANARSTVATTAQVAITPTAIGSYIYYFTSIESQDGSIVANSVTTQIFQDARATDQCEAFGYITNLTTALSSVTGGWTGFALTDMTVSAIEILPGTSPVTVNLTTAKVNVAAISPVVNIGGKVVSLTTAQVNVAAIAPTVTTAQIISGAQGSAGSIKLTYVSPSVQALAYSLSPTVTLDSYGNQLPIGYQGPLAAIQPGSSPVVTETWHSLDLTVLGNATASGNGANGFFYRYRGDNEVEIVWDLTLTSISGSPNLVTLPTGYQPAVQQNVISSWYGTGPVTYQTGFSPHLLVFTSGIIQAENCLGLTTVSLCGRAKITLDTP